MDFCKVVVVVLLFAVNISVTKAIGFYFYLLNTFCRAFSVFVVCQLLWFRYGVSLILWIFAKAIGFHVYLLNDFCRSFSVL